MKFNYYGHSAFTLSDDVTTILFDPFITDNPWTDICPTDIACQYIIITHGHGDHYGDAEAIAKANDATIISTAEIANKAADAGCKAHAMHVGGSASFPFGKVRLTPAFHGSGIAGGLAWCHRRIRRQTRLLCRRHGPLLRYENSRSLRSNRLRRPAHWRQLHHGYGGCGPGSLMGAAPFRHPHPLQDLADHRSRPAGIQKTDGNEVQHSCTGRRSGNDI